MDRKDKENFLLIYEFEDEMIQGIIYNDVFFIKSVIRLVYVIS